MPSAAAAPDRGVEGAEEARAVRVNRRRASRICLVPSLVVGLLVGTVLVIVGLPVLIASPVFVLVAAGLMVWLWRRGPATVLRALDAQPSEERDRPRLHNVVDGLCATMGLPRPAICWVESPIPNAMAVGRDPQSATLVVTSALDRALTLVELEGVLAHELVHIKRHDTVVSSVAVMVTAPTSVVIGLPKAAERVHALVGRGREFSADQRAAGVVRYPPGIASALQAMAEAADVTTPWPPGGGRTAALTRWLWVDPMVGMPTDPSAVGELDATAVRAAAQSLR
jgi:heat shock protein HtpX